MLSLPLQDFIRTAETLTARGLAVPQLIDLITPEFARLVLAPDLLAPDLQQPGPDSYAQHVLHTDERGRFCLVSLVWRPGDSTPVHDHLAWGLAAVYRGHERETRYAWCDRPGRPPGLRPVAFQQVEPGEVLPIVPPSDIHQVSNPDPTPTVSLHLYGFDLRAAPKGSSVRRVYGPEVVMPPAAPTLVGAA